LTALARLLSPLSFERFCSGINCCHDHPWTNYLTV
jgi:hypothetical protein